MAERSVFVAAGKRGARVRWGPPRIIRLSELTDDQRRAITTYLEVATSAEKAVTDVETVKASAEVRGGSLNDSAA